MSKTIHLFLTFFLSILVFNSISVRAEYPGVTSGSFSVTDSGAANYHLPISTPAGIAGMSPDLAVTYSSSGGNGLMGVGFSLSGFSSSIHRCGGSHATDGKASGVRYTNADKICMNGQRLIRSSGTHWGHGAVYHTQMESFAKVVYEKITTSNGSASDRFVVYTKGGERHVYGHRVAVSATGLSVGKNVSAWLLSSEHDKSGNWISYQYQHLDGNRWLPKQVVWNNRPGKAGDRKAVFEYGLRGDNRLSYQRGIKSESKHLIKYIKTYIGSQLIKQYQFGYRMSPVSRLARLRWVQQSGSDGGKLPAHYFKWNDTDKGFNGNTAYKLPVLLNNYREQKEINTQSGDFVDVNNDGLVDFVVSYRDLSKRVHQAIYKNTGSGWQKIGQKPPTSFVMRSYHLRKKNIQQAVYADVNGDGYPDIVRSYSTLWFGGRLEKAKEVWINNKNWTWSKSSSFVPPTVMTTYIAHWGSNRNTSIDTDQLGFESHHRWVYEPMTKAHLTDINGDGRLDWVVSYNNYERKNRRGVWLNNGSKWIWNPSYAPPTAAVFDDYWKYNAKASLSINVTRLVDVNGDGLQDLVRAVRYKRGAPGATQLDLRDTWLNTGSGWQYSTEYKLPDFMVDYNRAIAKGGSSRDFLPQSRGSFIDVNGDGLVDWVRSFKDYANNTHYRYTWLNTGKGWVANAAYKLPGAAINDYSKATGNQGGHPSGSFFDVNRDGLVDWVVSYKNLAGTTVRNTYLNSGLGWKLADASYRLPVNLFDNKIGWQNSSVRFGELMDLNGDGAPDYLLSALNVSGGKHIATYLGRAKPADMLVKVTDSLKAETTIQYKSMMDSSVYLAVKPWVPGGESFRARTVIGPRPLVANTWQSNGIGGNYRLRYFYYHGLSDGKRGYLGFKQRRIWDPQQKTETVKEFYQEFPVTGFTKREFVYKTDSVTNHGWLGPNSQLLSYQVNYVKRVSDLKAQGTIPEAYDRIKQPSGLYTHAPRIRRSRTSEYELDKGHIRSHWVDKGYDAYLNPTVVTTATIFPYTLYENIDWANTFWKKTATQYQNDTTNWMIGVPQRVTVTHHAPGKVYQVRVTANEFNSRGLIAKVIVEPDKPEFTLTTTNAYDDYGNLINTTVTGQGVEPRVSSTSYDPAGMHAIKTTNTLGHSMIITPDPKCDAPKSATDANGLVSKITYDQFCRQVRTDHADSTWTTTSYGLAFGIKLIDGTIILPRLPKIVQRAKGQPDVTTYYDLLGRKTRVETKGFDGRILVVEKSFNIKGQIIQESQPYFGGDTVYWTQYYYDAIGRLVRTQAPDNSESKISYKGLTTVFTNALGQTQTKTVDIAGRLKTVLDAQGNSLSYDYDAVGNLLNTTDPQGNQVKLGYDHVGRKKWMDDPDMGRWTYSYNVLGELVEQKDAKGQVITSEFDKLGRMTMRTVQPGTTAEQISSWIYDTADNGIGKLAETHGPNGYSRRQTYDELSRPNITFETINGIELSSEVVYNAQGKIHSTRYPGHGSSIYYQYNNLGYLNRIYNQSSAQGGEPADLWVAEQMDANGNITKEHYGNGVTVNRTYHDTRGYLSNISSYIRTNCPNPSFPFYGFCLIETIQNNTYTMDPIGNLTNRRDNLMRANESFFYDNLNRLKTSKTTSSSINAREIYVNYQYDVLGNMTYRSDVGVMNYGENGYGPHAVSSIQQNQSASIIENVYNPYGAYEYDANGNLTSNGQRTVNWTGFNKPSTMSSIVNGEARGVSYSYGSDFQRITKTASHKDKTTRYYGGGAMEHITEGDKVFFKYYISVGASTLEVKYQQVNENGDLNYKQIEKHYLFKDHLGSTDVIVDDDGNIVERLSFSPWGQRRQADWSDAEDEITSVTNRGFTGHEMDDEIGLVNMNARIYDPVIGRFLSPDAMIPSATDLQAYNRYSYVRNNPLSFTDPTGFERIRVPGRGGYWYDTDNGKFYKKKYESYQGACGNGGNDCTKTRSVGFEEITDPGLIKHLSLRIGVVAEVFENHDELSRGNTKFIRNKYRRLADEELAGNGKTERYQALLDTADAASEIYLQLKSQARRGYRKLGFDIAVMIVSAGHINPIYTSSMLAVTNGASTKDILKGVAIDVVTGGAFQAFRINPKTLLSVDTIRAVGRHAVIGCLSSKAGGGSCSKGAAAAGGAKLVTIGFPGGHSSGKLIATIGVAGLVNGTNGAKNAVLGYLYNQMYMGGGAEGSMGGAGGHAEGGYFVTRDGKMIPYTSAGARATTSMIPHGEFYAEMGYVNPAYRTGRSWLGEAQLGFFGFHIRRSGGNFIGGGFNVSSTPSFSISSGMEHTKTY